MLASRARELQAEQEALREAQRRIVEELRDARVGPVEQQEIEEEVRFLDRRISAVRIKVAVVRDSAQKAAFLKAVERMEELRARARAAWEAVQASPGDEELAAELRASARAVRQHYAATQPEPDGPADVRYETVLSGCTADDRRDLRARWKELAASAAEAERRASGDSPAEREGSSTPGVHLHALYAPPVSLGEDSDSEDDGGQMADDADGESPPDPSDAGSSPLNAGPSPLHAGGVGRPAQLRAGGPPASSSSSSSAAAAVGAPGVAAPDRVSALGASAMPAARRPVHPPAVPPSVASDGRRSAAAPRTYDAYGRAWPHASEERQARSRQRGDRHSQAEWDPRSGNGVYGHGYPSREMLRRAQAQRAAEEELERRRAQVAAAERRARAEAAQREADARAARRLRHARAQAIDPLWGSVFQTGSSGRRGGGGGLGAGFGPGWF